MNLSDQSLYFKIRSNNPQFYEIAPQQEILNPSATANIVFKLRKDRLVIGPNERYASNLAKIEDKINGNLFEVQWTHITDDEIISNVIPPLKYSQILKIMVIQPEEKAVRSVIRKPSEIKI